MQNFNKLVDKIVDVIDYFISFVTAMVIIITIASVFMRYVVNKPLAWAEEVCLMGFAWFTFMGAGSAIRKRSVVSLDFFYEMMSTGAKKVVKICTTVLCLVAYCFIIYYGFKILGTVKMTVTAAWLISYVWLYVVIPVGGIISVMALVANLFDVLMGTDYDVSALSEEAQMNSIESE